MICSHYSDGPAGQIHWREWVGEDSPQRLLLCLHPAPYSGLYFTSVMPLLAQGHRVVAPDYPGYGASTPGSSEPTIEDYASAMLALADELAPDAPVDILGFHTGCLVGAQMAVQNPARIRSLVLVDVPYFNGEQQRQMLDRAGMPLALDAAPESIAGLWQSSVTARVGAMSLTRAVQLLAEQLRVSERAHWAFRAAFTYPCERRMAQLQLPTHVIATQSALLDVTRECAARIPGARLEERLDITRAVFEEGAVDIARSIDKALAAGVEQ